MPFTPHSAPRWRPSPGPGLRFPINVVGCFHLLFLFRDKPQGCISGNLLTSNPRSVIFGFRRCSLLQRTAMWPVLNKHGMLYQPPFLISSVAKAQLSGHALPQRSSGRNSCQPQADRKLSPLTPAASNRGPISSDVDISSLCFSICGVYGFGPFIIPGPDGCDQRAEQGL